MKRLQRSKQDACRTRIYCTMFALLWVLNVALPAKANAETVGLVSCAQVTRDFAFLDLYSLEVFTTDCSALIELSLDRLSRQPVEFHVLVHWDRGKPEQLPEFWREELLPVCSAAQERVLRSIYEASGKGDTVMIRYLPETGLKIEYQGEAHMQDPSSEMLRALMQLWFVHSPLAESLMQGVSAHSSL